MLSIISIGVRALQILFAVVVVGISATFMKDQHTGDSPTTTRFSVFVGAYGMIAGAIGLVAVFFDRVPSLVPMVTDGLGALFFLAGGIAWAVGMKGQTCSLSDADKLFENPLLNQGCYPIDGGTYCYVLGADGSPDAAWDKLQGVCRKAFANETFLFVGFASFLVLIALSFLQSKRKGPKSGFVA